MIFQSVFCQKLVGFYQIWLFWLKSCILHVNTKLTMYVTLKCNFLTVEDPRRALWGVYTKLLILTIWLIKMEDNFIYVVASICAARFKKFTIILRDRSYIVFLSFWNFYCFISKNPNFSKICLFIRRKVGGGWFIIWIPYYPIINFAL